MSATEFAAEEMSSLVAASSASKNTSQDDSDNNNDDAVFPRKIFCFWVAVLVFSLFVFDEVIVEVIGNHFGLPAGAEAQEKISRYNSTGNIGATTTTATSAAEAGATLDQTTPTQATTAAAAVTTAAATTPASTTTTTNPTTTATPQQQEEPPIPPLSSYHFTGKPLYSEFKGDRSGAAIDSMLSACAFAFAKNQPYGGVCLKEYALNKTYVDKIHGNKQRKGARRMYNTITLRQALLNATGLDKVLKFNTHCPPGAGPMKLRTYISRDVFTTEFMTYLRAASGHIKNNKHEDEPIDVAVHVRRGDISPCTWSNRYLPNVHYINILKKYVPVIDPNSNTKRNIHVTIYSQKDSYEPLDEFTTKLELEGYDKVTLSIDTDLVETWKGMATADYLITSISSFSHVPAIANPNTVLYTKMSSKPAPTWTVVSADILVASKLEMQRMQKAAGCEKFRRSLQIKSNQTKTKTIGQISF